mmetsp:Transcript_5137/g.18667  ORF Transcript_5137/g.18667 Transcript_5137/m.18667 type:complete len:570 (-) Transcript_5137:142-1851(-)
MRIDGAWLVDVPHTRARATGTKRFIRTRVMSDVDDDDIDAWLDSSDDDDVNDVVDQHDVEEEDEEGGGVLFDDDDDAGCDGDGDHGGGVDVTDNGDDAHVREEGGECVTVDNKGKEEEKFAVKEVRGSPDQHEQARESLMPSESRSDVSFGASFGSWASASFSLAKQTIDKASKSDVVSTLRRDLKELGAHVTGEDVMGNSHATTPFRGDRIASDDDNDDGPSAADAVRLAETFASSAWAAFGGAARGAQKVLEKAEHVLENAANDPRAFATNVKGKAQVFSGNALNALTNVVKITTDALTGDERDGADEILLEKLVDYGADAHRAYIESASERAIEDLFAETSEDEQKSVREDLQRIESILSGAAYDPVSPSASGASATFVAVQLDVEDCSEDRGNLSAEVLTSLIERFDASARQTSDTLAIMMRGTSTSIPDSSKHAAILATLEDGLDELRDDFVCRGLAELTTAVLERIESIAKTLTSGDGNDAARVASQVRAKLTGMDDDIKVLIEAAKETSTNVVQGVDAIDGFDDVIRVAIEQLTRDETTCMRMLQDARRQLAWIILYASTTK